MPLLLSCSFAMRQMFWYVANEWWNKEKYTYALAGKQIPLELGLVGYQLLGSPGMTCWSLWPELMQTSGVVFPCHVSTVLCREERGRAPSPCHPTALASHGGLGFLALM